jgi:hypothetical protein
MLYDIHERYARVVLDIIFDEMRLRDIDLLAFLAERVRLLHLQLAASAAIN